MCARGGTGRRAGFRWRFLGVTIEYFDFHSEKLLKNRCAPVAELVALRAPPVADEASKSEVWNKEYKEALNSATRYDLYFKRDTPRRV